jgi:2-polyprenyl-3-methyl-5-hydroxy-6-metoxy-1,4-benzoquinol methylase
MVEYIDIPSASQEQALRDYLCQRYAGVFDESGIDFHIRNHVGFGFAEGVVPWIAQRIPAGGKVLDVGTGFGAFVIAVRRLGFEAVGIESEQFEVAYARKRIEREMPGADPTCVFHLGDGRSLPFEEECFDAVTLWNVLEHVSDLRALLKQVARVLKPGGLVFISCPNYASFRQEAHYHVPWCPLMPRKIASSYLRIRGKNPGYFQTSIFYRTNWEVLRALRRLGMRVEIPGDPPKPAQAVISHVLIAKIAQPDLVSDRNKRTVLTILKKLHLTWVFYLPYWSVNQTRRLHFWAMRIKPCFVFYNPFKGSIVLCARKETR